MDFKRLRLFLRLYRIRIIVISLISSFLLFALFLMIKGIFTWLSLESFYKKLQLASLPLQLFFSILTAFVFAGIYTFFHFWFFFGGGLTKLGRVKVRQKSVNVHWSEVIGMEEIKEEAWEVVKLIKDRAHLQRIGGKMLRGVLMIGPPGCGKTYLAKAIATEVNVPFLYMAGSEIGGIIVGIGAGKIKNLFSEARKLFQLHGGCIIFIDEIDTVARPRRADYGFGAQMDANYTINQLLTEMDGLRDSDSNIVVFGATNILESELDPALMRPGRFDRKIYVGLPNLEDRKNLFRFYLNKIKYEPNLDIPALARRAVNKSPADISNIIREASLIAVRNRREMVTFRDISEALERIDLGLKRKVKMTEEERKLTAFHESGHLIVTYFLNPTKDVFKASIISRGPSMGVVWTPPKEELFNLTKEQILAHIKTSLGGYAAEKIKFGTTTTGVSEDFKSAMYWAHQMVWRLGMSKDSAFLGDFSSLSESSWWRDQIAEGTKERLNNETQQILKECLNEVEDLLRKEVVLLDRFAQELLAKEELEYDEIEAIFAEHGKSKHL